MPRSKDLKPFMFYSPHWLLDEIDRLSKVRGMSKSAYITATMIDKVLKDKETFGQDTE